MDEREIVKATMDRPRAGHAAGKHPMWVLVEHVLRGSITNSPVGYVETHGGAWVAVSWSGEDGPRALGEFPGKAEAIDAVTAARGLPGATYTSEPDRRYDGKGEPDA